ncbi:MAG: glutamate 5-kinase [Caldilineae bacterium]|nr:MAG: glutamate 5-kinase [Caldilineae bacterium]
MPFRPIDSPYRRIVVKLGTSVLTAGTPYLSRPRLLELVRQCARLRHSGIELILVSSGAMAAGKEEMGFPALPPNVPAKQMLSAVGQVRLMGLYRQFFEIYGIPVGQMLLTRADLQERRRYLNARMTLAALLEHDIVPIVNENDTVTAEEIRVGDNDNLSAMVATLAEADLLILLTDQPGLFTADPRQDPHARLISEVEHIDEQLLAGAGGSSSGLGTGGMATKLQAAETATRGGTTVIIAAGGLPDVLPRLAQGESLGTRFHPRSSHLESRKRWLLAGYTTSGRVQVDAGAVKALTEQGGSLLPIGITRVIGQFERGDTISICTEQDREIARGVVRYHAEDVRRIKGHHSRHIEKILGYEYGDAVIHRNDLIIL